MRERAGEYVYVCGGDAFAGGVELEGEEVGFDEEGVLGVTEGGEADFLAIGGDGGAPFFAEDGYDPRRSGFKGGAVDGLAEVGRQGGAGWVGNPGIEAGQSLLGYAAFGVSKNN